MNLSLSDQVKEEVSNTRKQYLKEDGSRVIVKTPNFYREDHLKLLVHADRTSVLVPLDPATKAKFQEIETFVKANVVSEKYKPLWLYDAMYVTLSKWCHYELIKSDGSRQPLPSDTFLGKGTYRLEIHVSHVYIGPHKGGETFSLSLHVVGLAYEPEYNSIDEIDEIVQSMRPPSPSPPKPVLTPVTGHKTKGPRKQVGRNEINGPKQLSYVQKTRD